MKKIGILSDTHGLLRPEVLEHLQGCDAILHGGDINRQDIIDTLKGIAPVYVVRGNNDKEWAEDLPLFLEFSLFGLCIYMTHKKKDLPKDLSGYDLVVYGHSHKYEEKREGKTLLLNPGSCGPRRFNQEITMAVMTVDDHDGDRAGGQIGDLTGSPGELPQVRRIDIPHQAGRAAGKGSAARAGAGEDPAAGISAGLIGKIIWEIEKGRSASQIAAAFKLDPELAEQICRLYLTHPGVDAQGIMTKMGL